MGNPKDMLSKALEMGFCFHRGPAFGEHGGSTCIGTVRARTQMLINQYMRPPMKFSNTHTVHPYAIHMFLPAHTLITSSSKIPCYEIIQETLEVETRDTPLAGLRERDDIPPDYTNA